MIRALTLLALFASPAWSQNTDPKQRAVEAYVACLATKGEVALAAPNFGIYGWTDQKDTTDGTIYTKPGAADTTFALLALDGSFCRVESTVVGTEAALAVLTGALRFTEFADPLIETDAAGCTILRLVNNATATLTSGGTTPGCTSDAGSVITFDFAPQK